MADRELIHAKIDQAVHLLEEFGLDLWLTFVRETSVSGDPVLPLIYGRDLTWQSALLITRRGERLAIVGRYEADAARALEAYEVIHYDEGIREILRDAIRRFDPESIAINTSQNDVLSDGLSHGMYQILSGLLEGTPFSSRLVSAELLVGALRARKIAEEVERIRGAVRTTEKIYARTFEGLAPGMEEREVAAAMLEELDRLGLETAWERSACPAVNAGPDSPVGHGSPTDIRIRPGHLVHFDFGVRQDGYCSDIQRVAYVLRPGEDSPPEAVARGFRTVAEAVRLAAETLKPGVRGADVDARVREFIVAAGYPEYKYATGHQMGRAVHDAGTLLGPRWERYGDLPDREVEAGHVYTLEPGLPVPGYGYVGLEEDVFVTDQGAVFLSDPQTELILIKG